MAADSWRPDIADGMVFGGLALALWGVYVLFGIGWTMLATGAAFVYVGRKLAQAAVPLEGD